MPRDAFTDIMRCLHFVDDWEEDGLDYVDSLFLVSDGIVKHEMKHGNLEESHWCRCQKIVHPGMKLTGDESRCPGWYHSDMTMEPEPKPVCTGCTLHTLCVVGGPLAGFKIFVQAYGGQTDEDLTKPTEHCASMQKWINLYDAMLDPFKGKGHWVTCDSAYMGEILADISRNEWKTNMLGTLQANQNGAD